MRNRILITRVSSLAIAAVLTAGAMAQSFQGTPSVTFGSVNISEGAGTTDLDVLSPTAVIDWTPDDNLVGNFGAIAFQSSGTTATYGSAADFAVLNRINVADPSRLVSMNGNINSLVNGQTGGAIYFYSPSGFVIGPNAVINVGSLVLTALPIIVDGQGNFINNGTVIFGQAPNPGAQIVTVSDINGTAQINAPNQGSYVAMVAPRVEHQGVINVNGAAALVGAEAATIHFRTSGLFDIQVDVGTTDANGVVIDGGVITGVASSGGGDNHRIYAVAVPKNTALTMLISGGAELGFDVAGAADVVGNTVVLSAGHDVFFGSPEFQESAASGAAANANILNSSFTSAFDGQASGNIDVGASAGQSMNFFSDASLTSSGGYVQVEAFGADALLVVDGNLGVVTDRFGDSTGETVTAGQAAIYAQGGGQLIVSGNVNVSANGYGGDSYDSEVASGHGTGGQVQIQAEAGSSLSIGGSIFATADGYGGQPGVAGVNAGNGAGGSIFIGTIGSSGSLGVNGATFASASGFGGHGDGSFNECFSCNGLGGTGTGGTINIGTDSGTGSTAFFGDVMELHADGEGGKSALAGSASGTGSGGTVNILAAGGSQIEGFGLTFSSDLVATAIGLGGESLTTGITAGLGEGGLVQVYASANSTMGIFGDLDVDAGGVGGFNDFAVDGGDGQGGQVNMFADGGNAFITVAGAAQLEADGVGSYANSDCLVCGGIGGDGFGGLVQVYGGSGTGNEIAFASFLDLSANGYGGIGVTGLAGIGDGGQAHLNASAGLTLSVGTVLTIDAYGYGGLGFDGNGGGDGFGGTAAIYGNGGNLDVAGNSFLGAGGFGGGTDIGAGGISGDGTGGVAEIYVQGGSFDFIGDVFVEAIAAGGDSVGGTGGNATGGSARVGTDGGTIHAFGNLFLDGSASGGDGDVGGNAAALFSDPQDELQPIAAAIYAGSNGSVEVDGTALLTAEAVGGDGANGNGGNAQAGEVDVVAYVGDIALGSLGIDVDGIGGNGGNGGNGGVGHGGVVDVAFGYADASVAGAITLGSATITADGLGGDGGAGTDGNTGGNGGNGGDGIGGDILFAGSAAGGTLDSGPAIITALGIGGAGGTGGNSDGGSGGDGGAGGLGDGGFIQAGTISSDLAATSGGGASYTTLHIDASATGGSGGDGGIGGVGQGNGGDGGNAIGGQSNLLARGVLVSADTVQLTADATGGDGGTGASQGNGGNATTGFVAVESKDRFGHPTQRGTLEANSITASAIATGGAGAVSGTSTVADGSYFRLLNGDATIGSLSIELAGDEINTADGPSLISVRDGTAAVGTFSFITSGQLALDASNGSMTSDTLTLSASTFVPDSFNPAPTADGSYIAGNIDVTTGGDFVTNANLDSGTDLAISAPGNIDAANIVAAGFVQLDANGGTMAVGDIIADGFVALTAPTSVTTGDISAGQQIEIASDTIVGGNMVGGGYIDLFAGGPATIMVGDLVGHGVYAMSIGDITTGDITSTFDVDLQSFEGSIATGDIMAADNVFASAGAGISTGGIFSPTLIQLLAGSGVTINGPVDTGFMTIGAGGLLSLNGDVTADGSSLTSSDIELADGVTVSGFTSLYSTNPEGTFVGDGLAGPGYMLSNAEYNSFQAVSLEVRPDLGAAPSLILGDLDIDSSVSEAWFAIEDDEDNDLGTIRVVGAVRMNNGAGLLGFESETFQLDAATGSVVISADGTTPGGELYIQANNIHVAEGTILDQLLIDPQYEGYQDDLNAPASTPRPDGVIRAGSVTIELGDTPADFYTLYVQNVGTAETPAGFVITDLNLGDDGASGLPPGSVDLIINGQIVTASGTLTGADVRDLLVDGRDLALFAENSTINGCLLTGPCIVIEPEPPVPPDFQPSPGIQQEIQLVRQNLLPPPEFGNEAFIDDNDETTDEGETSPIEPPQPLFDTSALGDQGDVNDPVSGSGNPALMETPPPSSDQEQQQ